MDSVKIAGTGPAGLSAAINLARQGYQVQVFEKNIDVGGRFHGEFQGLENWSDEEDALIQLKKMNICLNFDYHPFKNLSISNGEKIWNFKCNNPAFYLVKRGSVPGSLDNQLKVQAEDNGVIFHFNKYLPDDEADIIATGPVKQGKFAIAQGITFQTEMEDNVICLVNDKAALKGYSYLLVAQGQATMGTVLFCGFNKLNHCFLETKKTYENMLELDIKNPQKIGGIGSFSLHNNFKKNGKLYIGEAAGLQDLLWGFGINKAMKSGYLAARSIIKGEDYESNALKYFNNKLKASLVNRYLWEKFARNNYSIILNRIYNAPHHCKYLKEMHSFNLLQKIIYPFALRYMKSRYENLSL
ncbi:MAG: NAD(P)/FAD-dependent oxidoreductase [Methanobacterium sp.]|nr:NAD(P)/FAD-dependent oxidoreductase [Methanobacterium sp.]